MARKSNTTVKGANGKEYNYCRITKVVGKKANKRGEMVSVKKQFVGKTKKEALEKYEQYMRTASWDGVETFGGFVDRYISTVFRTDGSLKESTRIKRINDFHRVFDGSKILSRNLSEISGLDLQTIINKSDSGASTVKSAITFLKRFYTYIESQHISRNVANGLILPTIEHKTESQDIVIYEDAELKKLLDCIPDDHRLRFLIILASHTGCRIGELLALTYDDIKDGQLNINKTLSEIEKEKDSENKTAFKVTTPKTKTYVRNIPLSEKVLKEFAHHKSWHQAEMMKRGYRTPYIFTTESGNFLYRRNAERSLKRLCESNDIPFKGWHALRHTFASRLAKNGVPIQTVSKMLGHDSINVTSRYYVNVSNDEKMTAIKALGL